MVRYSRDGVFREIGGAAMTKEQPMGMFSAQAAELFGTTIWSGLNGQEIEITAFYYPSKYKWNDKIIVGPADRYIRQGKSGPESKYEIWDNRYHR